MTGYLDKHYFENREGYNVKKGEPLFKIDPRVYEAELNRSEAASAQARALLERTGLDYKRAVELMAKHAMAQSDYDLAKDSRDEAAAAVKTAEAVRDSAKLNVEFTLISAPFDGQVSRRLVDPGNLITANVTILTSIVQRDPMYAYFDIDEGTMLHIRRLILAGEVKSSRVAKMPVYLQLKDEHAFPHKGVVNFVDNAVDPMQGTLRVRGVFPQSRSALVAGTVRQGAAPRRGAAPGRPHFPAGHQDRPGQGLRLRDRSGQQGGLPPGPAGRHPGRRPAGGEGAVECRRPGGGSAPTIGSSSTACNGSRAPA